jgi:hypothetical protein
MPVTHGRAPHLAQRDWMIRSRFPALCVLGTASSCEETIVVLAAQPRPA